MYYGLKHRKLTPIDNVLELEINFKRKNRRIRGHKENGYYISTVFLGVKHVGGVFETMIIAPDGHFLNYQERCNTHREALFMHKKARTYIKENC